MRRRCGLAVLVPVHELDPHVVGIFEEDPAPSGRIGEERRAGDAVDLELFDGPDPIERRALSKIAVGAPTAAATATAMRIHSRPGSKREPISPPAAARASPAATPCSHGSYTPEQRPSRPFIRSLKARRA